MLFEGLTSSTSLEIFSSSMDYSAMLVLGLLKASSPLFSVESSVSAFQALKSSLNLFLALVSLAIYSLIFVLSSYRQQDCIRRGMCEGGGGLIAWLSAHLCCDPRKVERFKTCPSLGYMDTSDSSFSNYLVPTYHVGLLLMYYVAGQDQLLISAIIIIQ